MQPKKNRDQDRVKVVLRIDPEDRDALEAAALDKGLLNAASLVRVLVREFVAGRKAEKKVANG